MKRGNQLGAAVVVGSAAKSRNRIERPEQRARGKRAEGDDHLWPDDINLLKEKRLARLDFVLLGIPVLRRPAFDDVRDVHVIPLEPDRLDDLRQQLAGAADERDALDVFIAAR